MMPARCCVRGSCFRRCFLRCAFVFFAIIIPLNFIVLKSEVEELGGQVPWGSNFKNDDGTQTNPLSVQQEILENDYEIGFLETLLHKFMRLVGVNMDLTEKEMRDYNALWPESPAKDDRIVKQINWRLPVYAPEGVNPKKLKIIYDKDGMIHKRLHGRRKFQLDNCPIDTCFLTRNIPTNGTIQHHAMIFRSVPPETLVKLPGQVWVWFSLESPYHMGVPASVSNKVNWTATYRRDSTLVAPYEKFVPFSNFTKLPDHPPGNRNYAKGKDKKVAWFVTNCKDQNGRLAYVKELQKHIDVDIYGACGKLKCPRKNSTFCYETLNKHYKFYLSFENSACKGYITEKLYWNAL